MIKTCLALSAVLALGAFALPSAANAQLADGGFENSGAQVGSSYCYLSFDCANGGVWTGANNSGFQSENNTLWPGLATPDGSYYAFIQNEGYIQQTFTADDTGTFTLTGLVGGRPAGCCQGNETFDVSLNGLNIFSGATVTGQPFTEFASNTFVLQAGTNYTLKFQGTSQGPDNSSFIDRLGINKISAAVPEPASWAMMILGFGGIGAVLRTRRRQFPLAA